MHRTTLGFDALALLPMMVAASFLVACSTSGSGGGGAGGAGGSNGSGGGAEGLVLTGNVATGLGLITSTTAPTAQHTTAFSASFQEQASISVPALGHCAIVSTPVTPAKNVLAGAVTVTGGNEAITLMREGTTYGFSDIAHLAWAADATLTMNVGGSGPVPAMSGSVTAPGKPVITSPTLGSTPIVVDRGKDFPVAWQPFAPGQLLLQMVGTSVKGGHAVAIDCLFEGAAGAGSVPAALLTSIAPSHGTLGAESFDIATSTVGDWSLLLVVAQDATDPNGALADFQLTYK